MTILVPEIHNEGQFAATHGLAMTAIESPLGFTFCPYQHGSVERWNFLSGCVQVYMAPDAVTRGGQ